MTGSTQEQRSAMSLTPVRPASLGSTRNRKAAIIRRLERAKRNGLARRLLHLTIAHVEREPTRPLDPPKTSLLVEERVFMAQSRQELFRFRLVYQRFVGEEITRSA